jgi:uncharacterized protein YbjT (DUF2867 family)
MILITGATGNVGSEIARQLIAKGVRPKIFARDVEKLQSQIGAEGYEVALGDFNDATSFESALDGVDAIYMVTNQSDPFRDALTRMVSQAEAKNLKSFVLLSAEGDADSDVFFVKRTGELEEIVKSSKLPWTILRPDWFMQNFAGFVAMGMVAFPAGPGKTSFTDVRDVAEVAIKALTEEGHTHRTYRLTGPDAMTFEGAAKRLSASLGREIPFVGISPDDLRDGLIAQGAEPWYAQMNADMTFALREGFSFSPSNDIRFLLGREARSLETFVQDHAQQWTQSRKQ